eukprot:1402358-Amphidinium_carterae.1
MEAPVAQSCYKVLLCTAHEVVSESECETGFLNHSTSSRQQARDQASGIAEGRFWSPGERLKQECDG